MIYLSYCEAKAFFLLRYVFDTTHSLDICSKEKRKLNLRKTPCSVSGSNLTLNKKLINLQIIEVIYTINQLCDYEMCNVSALTAAKAGNRYSKIVQSNNFKSFTYYFTYLFTLF